MSSPGPGQMLGASIEIDGPRTTLEIKACLRAVREALEACDGRLVSQQIVGNPLKRKKKKKK